MLSSFPTKCIEVPHQLVAIQIEWKLLVEVVEGHAVAMAIVNTAVKTGLGDPRLDEHR